jgi:hypothetical protein
MKIRAQTTRTIHRAVGWYRDRAVSLTEFL